MRSHRGRAAPRGAKSRLNSRGPTSFSNAPCTEPLDRHCFMTSCESPARSPTSIVGAGNRRVQHFDAFGGQPRGKIFLPRGMQRAHLDMDQAFLAGLDDALRAEGVFLDVIGLEQDVRPSSSGAQAPAPFCQGRSCRVFHPSFFPFIKAIQNHRTFRFLYSPRVSG